MKKHQISKFYYGINIISVLFGVFCFISGIRWYVQDRDLLATIPFTAGVIGIILPILQMCFDFQGGTFSVSKQGIRMNIGFRRWDHNWGDFVDMGIVKVNVGDGCTYWVYFSRRELAWQEKKQFLQKTRRDLNNIVFFQYRKKVMEEIFPLLPVDLAEKLKQQEHRVEEELTILERPIHK